VTTKDWKKRLSETITVVKQHGPLHMDRLQFATVSAALDDWDKSTSDADRKTVSELMSFDTDKTGRRSSEGDRDLIRAAVLVSCAFRYPIAPVAYATIADQIRKKTDSATSVFANALSSCFDAAASSPAMGKSMIDALKTDPRGFLQTKCIVPSCGMQPGLQWFTVEHNSDKWKINVSSTKPTGFASLQALVVPPTLFNTVGADGTLVGTASDGSGAEVMLTTQFTGCSFCFSINGTSLVAAHVDPGGGVGRTGGTTGEDARKTMVTHTGFRNGNGGTFKVYGRLATSSDGYGYGNIRDTASRIASRQMAIIGLLGKNGWKLWSQQVFVDGAIVVQRIDK
jgi:hypothetical protein